MDVERRIKEASALRNFFHEQWQHLLGMLDIDEDEISSEQDHDLPVADALNEMVVGTDARIRAVSNYKKSLRSGVTKLLQHIDGIVEQIDGPIKVSRKGFVYDPQVSALLDSMDDVKRLCDESDEIQEYLKKVHPEVQDSFFALLHMHYHERDIFGDELRGDVIHRDVKQTSVFFTGHKLLAPAASESEVKRELKHILFEDVVEYLKLLLNSERQAEAKSASSNHLNNGINSLNNPSRYLDELIRILELPMSLITLEENSLCVNKMGIKVSSLDKSCNEIHLQEVEVGGGQDNILVLLDIVFSDIERG